MHHLRSVLLAHLYIYDSVITGILSSLEKCADGCKTTTLQLLWWVCSFHQTNLHRLCTRDLFRANRMWRWRPSTESHASCLLLPEARRSSGFDVGEACVGLAAAGWGAQVPRAAALWERRAEMTKTSGVKPQLCCCGAARCDGALPTWAGERLAGLGFSNERQEISSCDHALLGSAQVAYKPAGPYI